MKTCTICKERGVILNAINQACERNESNSEIAKGSGFSRSMIWRHRTHCLPRIQLAARRDEKNRSFGQWNPETQRMSSRRANTIVCLFDTREERWYTEPPNPAPRDISVLRVNVRYFEAPINNPVALGATMQKINGCYEAILPALPSESEPDAPLQTPDNKEEK